MYSMKISSNMDKDRFGSTNLSKSLTSTTKSNYFDATYRNDKEYYSTVKNILEDNDLYQRLKFNRKTYKPKNSGFLFRVKMPDHDDWISKKSLNFKEQFERKYPENFTKTMEFDHSKYKQNYINSKIKSIDSLSLLKSNDRKKYINWNNLEDSKRMAKEYKSRENKAQAFLPPPKFNDNVNVKVSDEEYLSKESNYSDIKGLNNNFIYVKEEDNSKYKNKFGKDLMKSDILNDSKIIKDSYLKKCGEKSIFFPSNKVFTSNSLSNSVWIPGHFKPSIFNHTNYEFNILNPSIKNISPVKHHIINDENKDTITRKQKSISEFAEITRNGSPNPNKEFLRVHKSVDKPFNMVKNICSEFGLMAHYNKDMVGPAFTTKK